jgi:hypothetical protein
MTRSAVNRYLKDKAMDHIDHALGRPVDPMQDSYRNHFATYLGNPEADEMAASPCWHMGRRSDGGMIFFHVTPHGRKALADHLRAIGDKNRAFIVTWRGYANTVVAETHSKARYSAWLDARDAYEDLTFAEFQRTTSVRVAP